MPLLIRLAVRNLWRNRRRTILTFGAVALGIVYLILVDSLLRGLTQSSIDNLLDFESGDLQIHAPGYFDEREDLPLEPALPVDRLINEVRAVAGVRAAAPRLVAPARLHAGWEEFPVVLVGIEPELDSGTLRIMDYVEGRAPENGAAEAMIGASLAELLEIGTGDWVVLTTRTRDGAIQALDVRVTGLVRTPNPNVNRNHVYLPLNTLGESLAVPGEATVIVVRAGAGESLKELARRVGEHLAAAGTAADVYTWEQSNAELVALIRTETVSDGLVIAIILAISLVGIANTTLLSALERRREIGTMKALGMREGEIVGLFLLEAVATGLLAVGTGFAVGAAANAYLVAVGMDISAFFGDLDVGYPVTGVVYGVWHPQTFVLAGAAGLVTCALAAYLPARRAARQDAAATLRP
ncbi:MAG: ABC transporter permease [Firmicutes bacterium]|nr:ABC transporter permease [Bacillota bacterium]